MSEQKKEYYLVQELDETAISAYTARNNQEAEKELMVKLIKIEDQILSLCWGVSELKICIEEVYSDKIIVKVKAFGKTVARLTLDKNKTCAKVKSDIGDLARVDVRLCVDFNKKEMTAKGKICAAFVCTKFNQIILQW